MTVDESRPAYLQVADALRAQIAAGRLQPGQRLPSVRDLSEDYGLAPVTTRNALRVLRDEGLIIPRSTRGYFVREDLPSANELREQPSHEYLALRQHLDLIQDNVDELTRRLSHLEEVVLPPEAGDSRGRPSQEGEPGEPGSPSAS